MTKRQRFRERDRQAVFGVCPTCQLIPCICGGAQAPDIPAQCRHGTAPAYKCPQVCACGHNCFCHCDQRGCMAGDCPCMSFAAKEAAK